MIDDPIIPAPAHAAVAGFLGHFDRWLAQARRNGALAGSSEAAYRHLWSVFVKWAVGQEPPLHIDTLSAADLQRFIASRHGAGGSDAELSPRYVWRLLHLVDRVTNGRVPMPLRPPRRSAAPLPAFDSVPAALTARAPPAKARQAAAELLDSRPDWRYANAAAADPLPEHLSASQARRLVRYLSQGRPRGEPARAAAAAPDRAGRWQTLRNRVAVALQLGAGLSPGDVRSLLLDGVVVDGGRHPALPWKLRVEADGTAPAHDAPIAPWAGRLLRHWLQVRAAEGIAGAHLLPSTRSGKPWGKVALYQAVKQVLTEAGFDDEVVRGGSFRLRHTFALRQLRRGHAPEEVARWLGLVDPASMLRYQRVLLAPVDALA